MVKMWSVSYLVKGAFRCTLHQTRTFIAPNAKSALAAATGAGIRLQFITDVVLIGNTEGDV